jgi:hypothetical protein
MRSRVRVGKLKTETQHMMRSSSDLLEREIFEAVTSRLCHPGRASLQRHATQRNATQATHRNATTSYFRGLVPRVYDIWAAGLLPRLCCPRAAGLPLASGFAARLAFASRSRTMMLMLWVE